MTEAEEVFQNIIKRIATKYNIESLDKNVISKHLEIANPELSKLFTEYSVLVDSYLFIKSDKMLMLKARDVWMMELKLISESVREIAGRIESIIN